MGERNQSLADSPGQVLIDALGLDALTHLGRGTQEGNGQDFGDGGAALCSRGRNYARGGEGQSHHPDDFKGSKGVVANEDLAELPRGIVDTPFDFGPGVSGLEDVREQVSSVEGVVEHDLDVLIHVPDPGLVAA